MRIINIQENEILKQEKNKSKTSLEAPSLEISLKEGEKGTTAQGHIQCTAFPT